ncbi:Curli biogenesis system outer membrane secretion channel CsgG [Rhodoferax sp. OV413]|uniref:peptidoglycan-binding protein n=1 Tax=Rhodoferax sp. OV413 TaxID=1855285 RepID=UPI000880F7E6|nr:peptidoglycan-binding protein [Rhodoferax sp. OV413]SDO66359.1 Curli biogenesis system outer membrane secretion channel CsgG [Rhodoferax sp. OV413]
MHILKTSLVAACVVALLAGCETTDMKMGSSEAKTVATGSAGGATSANENSQLEKCPSALGTVSLIENEQAGWYTILRNEYRLPPTANLLRLMIQQSNCFIVVERSAAGMNAMSRERALMNSGEMRQGSNFGKGQVVSSDYGLSPEVIFNQNTGGAAASIGGLFGNAGRVLGAVAGSTATREASVMLTMIDNRSSVQVAASEGSASKTDWGGMGALFGGSGGGAAGAYNSTPQGKVIAAAFMDAYNGMVRAVRNYRAQTVQGQGLGGGGKLGVDGGAAPSQTSAPGAAAASMSLKSAQERLNKLGYDAGVADGSMGRKTVAALNAFQKDRRISQTGRLDAATIQELAK